MSLVLTDRNLTSTLHLCTLSLSNDLAMVVETISVPVVETGISENIFSNDERHNDCNNFCHKKSLFLFLIFLYHSVY